jgi:hypothetical protein
MARICIELAGVKFGRLTAVRDTGLRTRQHQPFWLFRCACGRERIINLYNVRSGASGSCGCLRKETVSARTRTHGASLPDASPGLRRAYASWASMIQRCTNPKRDDYERYGALGIRVCRRWTGRGGFVRFLHDMGERPEGTTLDRIKSSGNYCPENCRWATLEVQIANRRDYHKVPSGCEPIAPGATW